MSAELRAADTASRLRRLGLPLSTALVGASAWAGVALLDPTDDGRPWCPFKALTGLDCPFCGATRAAAALAHGDLLVALDHNAFFVAVVLPVAVFAWVRWARAAWRGAPAPVVSNRAMLGWIAVTGAWWALRLMVVWLSSGLSSGSV